MKTGDAPPTIDTAVRRPTAGWGGASGARIGTLFHRALSLVFVIAWVSLASQVLALVGSRGLMPLADLVDAARAQGTLSLFTFPSLLALVPGDGPLVAGAVVGIALGVAGVFGFRPRTCAALQTILYLGYATACRTFLAFQWDNLLLECGLLAAALPAHRAAPLAHFLFRALLFKLYFESGIAKWQSPIHDWHDGSAMTFYYQTAPLPTALAWYAHHLPHWWHVFESRATLAIELVLPFAIFGARRARLGAAITFTLFQVVNAATANYGFFCYLTVALHLFLIDEGDMKRVAQRARGRVQSAARRWTVPLARIGEPIAPRTVAGMAPAPDKGGLAPQPAKEASPVRPRVRPKRGLAIAGVVAWIFVSLCEAGFQFGEPGPSLRPLLPVIELAQTFRVVNTFHLFAAVTRERIEPELQAKTQGVWQALHLRYKAGDPARAPRLVAPHQPRLDFQLWFYGLGFQRRQPLYVSQLLARLCEDPQSVAALFPAPLPPTPEAVRLVFWEYRFTSPDERRSTGLWWSRHQLASTEPFACQR